MACSSHSSLRIAVVANLVTASSGGIRTTIAALRRGYAEHGHRTLLVVPAARDARHETVVGTTVAVRSPRLPRSGGYRMIVDLARVERLLDAFAPDRLEVHDRFTLRALAGWAATRGVPATVVVHERLDALLDRRLPWAPARPCGAATRASPASTTW